MVNEPNANTASQTDVSHTRQNPYEKKNDEIETVSLLNLINILLRHRWKALGPPLVATLAFVTFAVLGEPTYTSNASFMSQTDGGGGRQLARLSGVAAQFGVDVPSGETGISPEFYASLVTSRRILSNVVQTEYALVREGDTVRGNLVELWEIEAKNQTHAQAAAIGRLETHITASTGPDTGIVGISVTTNSPDLSKQIADRVIELVNQFNLDIRQSQASAEAEFVRQRLEQARSELRTAEDSLKQFLESNRSFQNSPTLRFEHQRLERKVNLKQQVVSSLATRYEEAQINKVRNTPVVTVVTQPERPVRPNSGRLQLKGFLGLLLGGIVGVVWVFGAEFRRNIRDENREDYREFQSLCKQTFRDIRRIFYHFKRFSK